MRNRKFFVICLIVIILGGCKRDDISDTKSPTEGPTAVPTVTIADTPSPAVEKLPTIMDYYPMEADVQYQYEGEGNESASYTKYVEFIDEKNHRLQTRIQNDDTCTVHVLEIKEGTLSVIYSVYEAYYRKNYLDIANLTQQAPEVLLMEPIKEGTNWTLSDGRRREITSVNRTVETPYGSFQAIEVTTEEENAVTKDYYAAGVGPIKSLYESKDMADSRKVASELSHVKRDSSFTQSLRLFYPDSEGKINEINTELSFKTGEDAEEKLEEIFVSKPSDNYLPLMNENSRINSLLIDSEGVLNADFSSEFIKGMNLGSGYEQLVLQSLVNTLGRYFQTFSVRITIDGNTYESGHFIIDTMEVSQ